MVGTALQSKTSWQTFKCAHLAWTCWSAAARIEAAMEKRHDMSSRAGSILKWTQADYLIDQSAMYHAPARQSESGERTESNGCPASGTPGGWEWGLYPHRKCCRKMISEYDEGWFRILYRSLQSVTVNVSALGGLYLLEMYTVIAVRKFTRL